MEISRLNELMVEQLNRRGYYPKDEMEVLLRIGEEVGELYEAIREGHSKEEISYEIVDIFWNLLRLCIVKEIDFERAFIDKLMINEKKQIEESTN